MDRPIGMFDSGMGGLSVLAEARKLLPLENYVFYGDNDNAPYGDRTVQDIMRLSCAAVDELLQKKIKVLVIACNTATSVMAAQLRVSLDIPVVGMEPALKPAQTLRHGGKILVMATPATLSLPKFDALMRVYGEGVVPIPVRGLVERIQEGEVAGEALENFLYHLLDPYLHESADAIVLGCTHYIFIKGAIANVIGPDIPIVDGNPGTVRQLQRLLKEHGILRTRGNGSVELLTSGDDTIHLPVMSKLLALAEN